MNNESMNNLEIKEYLTQWYASLARIKASLQEECPQLEYEIRILKERMSDFMTDFSNLEP